MYLWLIVLCVYGALGRALPSGPLIIAYGSWGQCDPSVLETAKNGANVIIWFSIDLALTPEGTPGIARGVDYDCVGGVVKEMKDLGLDVAHLISIGGWNSPHIAPGFASEAWWEAWKDWNRNTVARPALQFPGFDGLDWDLEGNDNLTSPYNHFTVETIKLMGEISQLAKQDGFIVSMAPAQSYLDPATPGFDRSLQHAPEWQPGFPYHGLNTYAPLLAQYGTTFVGSQAVETFDIVSIQLYEGWARAGHAINDLKVPVAQYLLALVEALREGWMVRFSEDPAMGMRDQVVRVRVDQLVVGLANAWAGPRPSKFLLMYPEELREFWELARERGVQPRGFMFWDIMDEGKLLPNGQPLVLASALKSFIGTQCQA